MRGRGFSRVINIKEVKEKLRGEKENNQEGGKEEVVMKKAISVLMFVLIVCLMGVSGYSEESQADSIDILEITGSIFSVTFKPKAEDEFPKQKAMVGFLQGNKMKVACGPLSTTGFYIPIGSNAFYGIFYGNGLVYSFTGITTDKLPGSSLRFLFGVGYVLNVESGAGSPLQVTGYNKGVTKE